MNSSLYTGVLGLKNHQTRMDVIGNNIANVNTYGFKRGRATFSDLLSRTYQGASAPTGSRGGTNALQVGMGMTVSAITNIMTQGQTETTGRLTDVAIDGNGWFVIKDQNGQSVYTRDGSFGLDRDGTLVTSGGLKVQGWSRVLTDNDHNFTVDTQRPVDNIEFQYGEKLAAQATNQVGIKCNLKSDSRSLIADGLDPKEGYATKDDCLVDLYKLDSGEYTPESLGIREGDWLEVKASVAYQLSAPAQTYTAPAGTGDGAKQKFNLINSDDIPVLINSIVVGANTYDATNLIITDPDNNNDLVYESLGANEWVYNSGTGEFILGTPPAAGDTITVNYNNLETCRNTMPWQAEKYYYIQITNDTKISDLESAIQQTLDALDVNGTINAEVKYDTDTAKFTIYNNSVDGSRDQNSLQVDINAVSGSAIRQGFLLQDSTDKNVKGTRLSFNDGVLGNNMTRETIGIIDYQNDITALDYGDVDSSEQVFAEVVNTRLWANYTAATHADGISVAAGEWNGYTQNNTLNMLRETDVLTVNGVVWNRVSYFTGAANEYVVTDGNETTPPTIQFNTAAGLEPAANSEIILTYRPSNASLVQLSEGFDYTIDSATGNISLMWSGSVSDPKRILGNKDLTGSIKLTAAYTTEQRKMEPPTKIMDSRWGDYAQAFAEVNAGGDGKARTEFNNMWGTISTATGPAVINDQATSTQPTSKTSDRFLSADTHRTSISVYDSLGEAHELQFVFTHVGSYYDTSLQARYENQWFWRAELPYEDTFSFDSMDNIDGTSQSVARLKGTLQFDDNGLLQVTKLGGNTGPIIFDASPVGLNGNSTMSVETSSIEVNFQGNSGDVIDGVTQYASDFTTLAYEQNGWAMGTLDTFYVDGNGVIQGSYSNDVVRPIAQIALAVFPNEEGMMKLGDNLFGSSANSGTPTIVPAYVGGAGQIQGSSLEMSNVDIAQEFTDMIITERGFQANSRIITTSDEMLTEVLNMKR